MSRARPGKVPTKKLLVAAVGVATVNYAAIGCGGRDAGVVGNLMAPSSSSATSSTYYTVGNLVFPSTSSTSTTTLYTVGNLVAPSTSSVTGQTSTTSLGRATSVSTSSHDGADGGGLHDATIDGSDDAEDGSLDQATVDGGDAASIEDAATDGRD